jgi:hypothetical protein
VLVVILLLDYGSAVYCSNASRDPERIVERLEET